MHEPQPVMGSEPVEHIDECLASVVVDHGGDLVGDQERRFPGKCRGDGQSLQLATRQARGVTTGHTAQPDFGEQAFDVDVAVRRQPPHDVVSHAQPEHLAFRVLQDQCGPPTWPKPTPAGRSMLPVVGGTPAKMRMRVDLPVPLAPVTAMCSPTSTRIVTGASASRSAPAYR